MRVLAEVPESVAREVLSRITDSDLMKCRIGYAITFPVVVGGETAGVAVRFVEARHQIVGRYTGLVRAEIVGKILTKH